MHIDKYATLLFKHLSRYLHHSDDITFVTGANAPFYQSLRDNLLRSIHTYEPQAKIIVFDMGLTDVQLIDLQQIANEWGVRVETLPFDTLPPHYALDKQNYAFKSYCIFHTLRRCQTRYLLWLDAGCVLSKPLAAERNILHYYGFYSPYSATTVAQLTFPSVLQAYLEPQTHYGKRQMLSSGCVGVRTDSPQACALIAQWHHECQSLELLAPSGSDKTNHRQDQSVLSLAYYSRHKQVPLLARRWINIRYHLNKK